MDLKSGHVTRKLQSGSSAKMVQAQERITPVEGIVGLIPRFQETDRVPMDTV